MGSGRKLAEFLSPDDARDLLNAPYKSNLRDRLILGLMMKCGLRAGELVSSPRQHITKDKDTGEIIDEKKWMSKGIRRKDFEFDEIGQYARLKVVGGKGAKDRYVPVPLDLALLFKEYTKDMEIDQPIFDITIWSITPLVRRFAKRAGIEDRVWPHKLRHTFAVNALRSGWNIKEVQEVLGHEHLSTTEKYLHLTDDELATAHKRHPLSY